MATVFSLQADGKCLDINAWDPSNGAIVHLWLIHYFLPQRKVSLLGSLTPTNILTGPVILIIVQKINGGLIKTDRQIISNVCQCSICYSLTSNNLTLCHTHPLLFHS
jgi:hypothetical protein